MSRRPELSETARRVQGALDALGAPVVVFEVEESTRTSAEAAAAVGTTIARIAKSVVFRGATSDRPMLVLASGANRVDPRKVRAVLGEAPARADAAFVRSMTGFAIGGVPPVGHLVPPAVLLDADLFVHPSVWAAAGTPRALFEVTPAELLRITGGTVADVREDAGSG